MGINKKILFADNRFFRNYGINLNKLFLLNVFVSNKIVKHNFYSNE